jgi:serine protease Do
MKQYAMIAAVAALLGSFSAKAQQDDRTAGDVKKDSSDVIIKKIHPKNKEKTIVIYDDGHVTINGRPADQYRDDDVIVLPRDGRFDDDFLPMQKQLRLMEPRVRALKFMPDMDMWGGAGVRLGVNTKENDRGAEITRVVDSSAAFKAGLMTGDVITKVNESPISDPEALAKVIGKHKAGDQIDLYYVRGSKEQHVKVTLENTDDFVVNNLRWNFGSDVKVKEFSRMGRRPRLGAHIQDTEDSTGVKVLQVDPQSPAAAAGLQKDDIITAIDGKKVTGTEDAMDVLNGKENVYKYPMTINRNGSTLELQVKIPHELKSANL